MERSWARASRFLNHAKLFRLDPLGAMDSHQSAFLKGAMRSHLVFRKIPVAAKNGVGKMALEVEVPSGRFFPASQTIVLISEAHAARVLIDLLIPF